MEKNKFTHGSLFSGIGGPEFHSVVAKIVLHHFFGCVIT